MAGKITTTQKTIKLIKGHELHLAVSDDISAPESLMYSAYKQALRAVMEIDQQSRCFHQKLDAFPEEDVLELLFQYSSNIVAFAAPRGGGKTSTMLSFSMILGGKNVTHCWKLSQERQIQENDFLDNDDRDRIKQLRFFVLPPIAPSSLEEKKSILSVVLSRLFAYAVDQLEKRKAAISSNRKAELSQALQECLSGIRGLKQGEDRWTDLSELQDICDSMSLRLSFYKLVRLILATVQGGDCWKNAYLVLQLDDADSQIKVLYEVLEDIRRYFMIPNLIILTCADFNMLRRVVWERHLEQFKEQVRFDDSVQGDLYQTISKYVDKLIPPSHLVYLPTLENALKQWGRQIKLNYLYQDKSGHYQPVFDWAADLGLQEVVLHAIYRKTGVVFTNSAQQIHGIVPTTLRGLNQLMNILSGLKDIPRLSDEDVETAESLADALENKYLPIAEENLDRFTDYFCNDWINIKILDHSDRHFLEQLGKAANVDKISLSIAYLLDQYTPYKGSQLTKVNRNSRIVLDETICKIQENLRKQEDIIFFFALRTIFTLKDHKAVLHAKRQSLSAFRRHPTKLLAFQYASKQTGLPETYRVLSKNRKFGSPSVKVVFNTGENRIPTPGGESGEFARSAQYRVLNDCMICRNGNDRREFNFMNFVTYLLSMNTPDIFPKVKRREYQRTLFRVQEAALLIAENWEVQDLLVERYQIPEFESEIPPDSGSLQGLYSSVDDVLVQLHEGDIFSREYGIARAWMFSNKVQDIGRSIWTFIQENQPSEEPKVSQISSLSPAAEEVLNNAREASDSVRKFSDHQD